MKLYLLDSVLNNMYIYIYVYTCLYIYIYMHIVTRGLSSSTFNLDLRLLDSTREEGLPHQGHVRSLRAALRRCGESAGGCAASDRGGGGEVRQRRDGLLSVQGPRGGAHRFDCFSETGFVSPKNGCSFAWCVFLPHLVLLKEPIKVGVGFPVGFSSTPPKDRVPS